MSRAAPSQAPTSPGQEAEPHSSPRGWTWEQGLCLEQQCHCWSGLGTLHPHQLPPDGAGTCSRSVAWRPAPRTWPGDVFQGASGA